MRERERERVIERSCLRVFLLNTFANFFGQRTTIKMTNRMPIIKQRLAENKTTRNPSSGVFLELMTSH